MAVQITPYQGGAVAREQSVAGVRPVQSGAGELARGMQAVGDLFYTFQDEVDTADAKTADTQYGKLIQDALYAEGSGYMYSQGSQATSQRESVLKQIEARRDEVLKGLSGPARARAEQALSARLNEAMRTIDTHAATQGREYLNQASEARVGLAVSNAIYDPDKSSLELNRAASEVIEMGKRNGWPPEMIQEKVKEVKSQGHLGIINRIANADPMSALAYLRANKGDMTGSDVAKVENALERDAKIYRGSQIGRAVASGDVPYYQHTTRVDYAMGPARPNKPSDKVVGVIGKAVESVLGAGARVVVTSGQENAGHQHGSNRHGTGLAADVAIYTADGRQLTVSDPEYKAIAKAAAGLGALGIGFGSNYMGGKHMHIDLVPAGAGQANQWEDAKSIETELEAERQKFQKAGKMSINDIVSIPDPVIRDAALKEYDLMVKLTDDKKKVDQAAAMTEAWEILETGGDVEKLSFQNKQAIGFDNMNKLRSLAADKAAGKKIVTDYKYYIDSMETARNRPQDFLDLDPFEARDKLDDGDFQRFMNTRQEITDEIRTRGRASAKEGSLDLGAARSAINDAILASGEDLNSKKGAAMRQRYEYELTKWASAIKSSTGQPVPDEEVRKRVLQLQSKVEYDPSGLWNSKSGAAVQIDFQGERTVTSSGPVYINATGPRDLANGSLSLNGVKVPPSDVLDFIQAYVKRYGYEPEAKDVIDGLIMTGDYDAF